MTYTATINMPGCLPETEPVEFDTLTEALAYLADEIENDWGNDNELQDTLVDHHARMKAWASARNEALAATTTTTIIAPNGLAYSVIN